MELIHQGKKVDFGTLKSGDTFFFKNNVYLITDDFNIKNRRLCVNIVSGHIVDWFIDGDEVFKVNCKASIDYDD